MIINFVFYRSKKVFFIYAKIKIFAFIIRRLTHKILIPNKRDDVPYLPIPKISIFSLFTTTIAISLL